MNVLLDACALLALTRGELPKGAAQALRVAPEAYVSSVSSWEVAIKSASHKLHVPQAPLAWFLAVCDRYELREIPLDARTACSAASLPPIHRDPFDRVLAALALSHNLTVLTSDKNIPKYPGVKTLW